MSAAIGVAVSGEEGCQDDGIAAFRTFRRMSDHFSSPKGVEAIVNQCCERFGGGVLRFRSAGDHFCFGRGARRDAHRISRVVMAPPDARNAGRPLVRDATVPSAIRANALRIRGYLSDALKFARASAALYSEYGALAFEGAKSRLVEAQILDEMGDADAAMPLIQSCIEEFEAFSESTYRIMARMSLGAMHFRRKQFKKALSVFQEVVERAELEGNTDMLARGLHNVAEAARELGDIAYARELYPRVIEYMTQLQLTTELPRVTWCYALTLVAEGKLDQAVWQLLSVRNQYLKLGMNLDAATAELESKRVATAASGGGRPHSVWPSVECLRFGVHLGARHAPQICRRRCG